jgi:hypothetical protein
MFQNGERETRAPRTNPGKRTKAFDGLLVPGKTSLGVRYHKGVMSGCVFYIMRRAIVIAVILQSGPSIKMYMGLRAGKQLNQEHTYIQ